MSYDPKQLLFQSFTMARNSGRPDWTRMSIAVLKNRMLLLSKKTFDEKNYGAPTFRRFLDGLADVVSIDDSTSPPSATLLVPSALPAQPVSASLHEEEPDQRRQRVRQDLWVAIMDFSSGEAYAWDAERQEARRSENPSEPNPLPTLSRDELWAWRGEFAAKHHEGLNEHDQARLSRWASSAVSDRALPATLLGLWNAEVKSKILVRLDHWFSEIGLPKPSNMLQIEGTSVPPSEAERVRRAMIECVKVMTLAELNELRLSPLVVARVLADGHRGS